MTSSETPSVIRIRDACTHNLQHVNIDIPRNRLVVITGKSGSGKSSLAFDTVHAEGLRRYVESLAAGARQFLPRLPRPDVQSIDGLSPTVAIQPVPGSHNPRSTVATAAELYDYLRLLFSRAGTPHCPNCKAEIRPLTVDQIGEHLMTTLPPDTRFSVLSPVVRNQKGDLTAILQKYRRQGYVRALIDDELHDLETDIRLDARQKHRIDLFIDRLVMNNTIRNRLADSLELALRESGGLAIISPLDGENLQFTDTHSCVDCGRTSETLAPADFSFNSPAGACPACDGLGMTFYFEEDHIIPNPHLSIREGAITPWTRRSTAYYQELLDAVTTRYGIDPFCPWSDLSDTHRRILLHGTEDEIEFSVDTGRTTAAYRRVFEGVIPNLERRSREYSRKRNEGASAQDSDPLSDEFTRYMSTTRCRACNGARLKPESLAVTVSGQTIAEVCAMTVHEALPFFSNLSLPSPQNTIATPLLDAIQKRLRFLSRTGLDYLALDRPMYTLSGGEAGRIRLANRIGSALTGVTYVLDEPSVGLHPRDHQRLLEILLELRDGGNTILVVEHDRDTMLAADHLVDMGPGAGALGGQVVAAGTPASVTAHPSSLTGAYLRGHKTIPKPASRRTGKTRSLTLTNAVTHNLKDVTLEIPLGRFVAVTGVSGCGKSSVIMDTLLPAVRQRLRGITPPRTRTFGAIHGVKAGIDKVIDVDQGPVGRSPRSNPATFTGIFADIRELFATTPESRQRGYRAGRYSFNIKGGRCEACQGDGVLRVEMQFLPDAFVTCDVCNGRRYNRETLEVTYRGRTIADLLDMTCDDAFDFLEHHPKIRQKLLPLREVGLGYLTLGQNAATLSAGESQRLKLARELSRRATGRTLYILDEPTSGLHFDDIRQLLEVLQRLVDQGNTVIVIEHHLDVIRCADHVIDLGPDGGADGGRILATGTPEEIISAGTCTGTFLARHH